MSPQITWDQDPNSVLTALDFEAQRWRRAVESAAEIIAPRLESYAKQNARWTDRPGNARAGLSTAIAVSEELVEIYLYNSVSYAIFLEVARGGKYAIIYESIVALLPDVFATLQAVL